MVYNMLLLHTKCTERPQPHHVCQHSQNYPSSPYFPESGHVHRWRFCFKRHEHTWFYNKLLLHMTSVVCETTVDHSLPPCMFYTSFGRKKRHLEMLARLSIKSKFVENALFCAHFAHMRSTDHGLFAYLLKNTPSRRCCFFFKRCVESGAFVVHKPKTPRIPLVMLKPRKTVTVTDGVFFLFPKDV